ncbi:ubiquitin carboxyl-terminal hydrolase 17-like protein E isoform X1 [Mus musculus]|uniref:ubiquitin carboxyl-terminal hydrolase 17-like protein E isoform X1 n=1 Tax=Mus musculus TaxID=10090 RepID=UPI0001F7912D|nr:ubiquitin carboxyl-terminal hydrolase 17-like protein E isoform X1 [Mus musculus]|eukprot:XP_017177923.1 PREDICTED: ubiquitin carboxyl-terminal hydrolase 17-like protein E isoform X1 [Mus musculus]
MVFARSFPEETGGENLPSAPLEDSSKFFEEVFGDMVVALSFPEADPALSSPDAPELHQDEAQVVEELTTNGKHSLSWESPQGPGCGLQNTGNSCYLNAALQCLTHTPPLADYMLSQEHSQTCCSPEGCKMCAMEAHVTQSLLHSHSGDVMKPSQILTSAFHKHQQEDAHEFLMFTLETMHESCLQVHRQSDPTPQDTSPIHDIFGGWWRSQIKCLHCQGTSHTFDPFLDVPLDISSAQSVNQALWDTGKSEELLGENAYYCGRCRQKMPASKTLHVHIAPKVLLLVLKRFSAFTGNKLDRKVSYPEFLDLKPYLSEPTGGPLPYALYAVLVHDGATSNSGHYFCCVKAGHGKWYKMDDTKVTRCDVTSVLNENAYVLFYVQQTDLKQVSIDMPEGRVHEVLDPKYQLKKSRRKKRKKQCHCTDDAGEACENREKRAKKETSLGEGKVPQEVNHEKAGQKHGNTKLVPQEQNHQRAGQNLRNTEVELDLPVDAIVIHQPRSTANWGTDAPDKENQPWHNGDRLLTSQGLMSPGQLCSQGGR